MPGPLTAAELPSPVRGPDHPGPRTSASAPALKGSPSMTSNNTLLERVRKLLAKAESAGTTPPEAEALTAKAAELMAKYGIDRALLAAARPETDQPGDRVIGIPNPGGAGPGYHPRCAASASSCPPAGRAAGSTCSVTPPTSNGPTCFTPRCWCRCGRAWPGRTCPRGPGALGRGGAAGCSGSPPPP